METAKNIEPTEQPELQLVHKVKLWQGILKPSSHFSTLRDAEQIKGLVWRILLISLLTGFLTAVTTYLSMELNLVPNQDIPGMDPTTLQNLAVIMGGVGALFAIPLYMLVAAAIFTVFVRDVSFVKQFTIQAYGAFILLINTVISVPLMYLTETLTPFFSLGIIGESLHAGPFLQALLSSLTVFFIWQVFLIIAALKQTSRKSAKYITSMIIILHVVYLLIGAKVASMGAALAQM